MDGPMLVKKDIDTSSSLQSLYFYCISLLTQHDEGIYTLNQKDFQELLRYLTLCSQRIQTSRLFSTNDYLQDINTYELPLLLVDAYMADVILKLTTNDLKERYYYVKRAQTYFKSFLDQCELYDLVQPSEFNYFKAFSNPNVSPSERRNLKISRFKALKERETTLSQLRSKLIYIFSLISALPLSSKLSSRSMAFPSCFLSSFSSSSNFSHAENVSLEDEELISREFCIQWIQQWISKAMDEMLTLEEELKHLESALEKEKESLSSRCSTEKIDSSPPPSFIKENGPLLDKMGRPLRPFSILPKRTQLNQQVFQPGHRLPTMTIDEYLDAEKARGGILTRNEEDKQRGKSSNSDSDSDDEKKLIEARHWDNFKDDNPRGWGNKGGNRGPYIPYHEGRKE